MVRTRVGYAGGTTKRPTYRSMGDHTEALQIDFDPTRVTYQTLLAVFWESHAPTRPTWSRQYMSAIYCGDESQRALAIDTRDQVAARLHAEVHTEIVPLDTFHRAEDYHQKYSLQHDHELMKTFASYSEPQFVDSTVAARLNGYLAGAGGVEGLDVEIGSFGLDPRAVARLKQQVARNGPRR